MSLEPLALRLGVDPAQWRALVVVALKTDMRASGRAFDLSGRARGSNPLVGTLFLLTATGGGTAIIVGVSRDLFLGVTVFLFLLAFVLASSLTIEYQSVVLSPADHRQLSFQPVTSRTFLAARLTSVLLYMMAMTVAFCLVPLFVFLNRGGPLVAGAALGAAIAEAFVVTLLVIAMYVTVLTFVPAARLTRALSYVQLLFSFFIYGSYMLVPRFLGESALRGVDLPRVWWTLLNPASWFAGWVLVASGERTAFMAAAAGLSIAALVASVSLVGGRLSIDYAERLGEMGTTPAAPRRGSAARRPLASGWVFANAEARAVAVLVRAQFRYDNRFRLTVLSILPLTLVYMFSGFNEGGLDPFAGRRQGHTLVYMAVMMFPPMLRGALTQSDSYRAAWIFHGTPADKRALVIALKNFVAISFLLPYLGFVGAIYVAAVGRPWMVAIHVVLLGLISHLLLVLDLILNPDVPFSRPASRGGRTRTTFLSMMAAVAVGSTLQFILAPVYATPFAIVATLAGLMGLTLVAEAALRLRLQGIEAGAQFDM